VGRTARPALLRNAAPLRRAGRPQQIVVINEDLGAGIVERRGFARLTVQVALGHVGIVLDLEVSRLARDNADWQDGVSYYTLCL
jgi:DNA invertase Pin-like site-specific DNA recombinase